MSTITLIISPYHTGLHAHRVGKGPHHILSQNLLAQLTSLGLNIETYEIPRVDEFEGEIGRSFEVMRRTSLAVSEAVEKGNWPLVLSGNCMASVAVACGLEHAQAQGQKKGGQGKLGFIYFDSHDDLDSPDVNENGYFDAMGLSMLRGESWKLLMNTVPGYDPESPFDYRSNKNRFLYVGLRDQSELQRERVVEAGMDSNWGGNLDPRTDFGAELEKILEKDPFGDAIVHLDLDVLDAGVYGKVNDYPSEGGLLEGDLVRSLEVVGKRVSLPKALVVCQFDPDSGDGDLIAGIAIKGIMTLLKTLLERGVLKSKTSA